MRLFARLVALLGAALLQGCVQQHGVVKAAPSRDRARAQELRSRADLHILEQDWEAAERDLRQALQADPFDGPSHANLGVVLWKRGSLFDAGWELRFACQLMPKAAQPRHNLGLLFESVGRSELAEEQYRSALECDPGDVEIIGHLARIRVRQNKVDDETLALLHSVATGDDDSVWRNWAQGFLALRNKSGKSVTE